MSESQKSWNAHTRAVPVIGCGASLSLSHTISFFFERAVRFIDADVFLYLSLASDWLRARWKTHHSLGGANGLDYDFCLPPQSNRLMSF